MSKLYATMTASTGFRTVHFPIDMGEVKDPQGATINGYYSPTYNSSFDASTVRRVKLAQKLWDKEHTIHQRRKSTPADRKRKKLQRQNRRAGRS